MANIPQIVKDLKRSLSAFDVRKASDQSDNEAKTRMYLVEPFFETLRFNRGFENGNLIPEFDADFASLKGRKVDYAILMKGKPEIIIEVKKANLKLTDIHLRQLNEYFLNTQDSKIGVLTNGIIYNFYCRNNNGIGLHPKPFYVFDWERIDASILEHLAMFYSTNYDNKAVLEFAQNLFFLDGFEIALYKELSNPSRDFIRSIYGHMGGARMNENTEKQIKELINSVSLKSALERLQKDEAHNANSGIHTTEAELKVYHVVKTILAQHKLIDTNAIGFRDTKGKFSILMEDNHRKKVCDLYINQNSQRLDIDGEKFDIPDIDSIVKLKKILIEKALLVLQ
ncbi:MAG: hypothetical protein A3D92_07340 [Bacteroidetes bacterium RIFCSPHIGHO2_02_FULL_44_7]|nr:MAG: hypothetical protein A3D92_07340 [Bacteroidetes bacterium RIFCSPHIGHO2_02_FULL_44_7]